MALATQGELPFSLLNAIVKPYTGVSTLGAAKDIPMVRSVEISPNITEIEHRGDGRVGFSNVTYDSLGLTLEFGQLNLDVLATIMGGTVTPAGVSPNQTRTYARKTTDIPANFQLKAATTSITPDGGVTVLVLNKCRWAGGFTWPFADNVFPVIQVTAKAIPDTTDGLFSIAQNENLNTLILT